MRTYITQRVQLESHYGIRYPKNSNTMHGFWALTLSWHADWNLWVCEVVEARDEIHDLHGFGKEGCRAGVKWVTQGSLRRQASGCLKVCVEGCRGFGSRGVLSECPAVFPAHNIHLFVAWRPYT